MSTTNATALSNSTLPLLTNCSSICVNNDLPSSASSENEFSVQNVVGIFLTLSLCLLTQPYGSLFYNPPFSKIGQRLFFTWRLNPLACIAETAVIIVSLFLVLRLALQDPEHNTMPSLSRRFPFYHAGTERSRNWRRHWHLHAAALLLIRANEEGDGSLLERLMAESLLRDGDELAPVDSRGRQDNALLEDVSPVGGSATGAAQTPAPQLGILRRRTSQLEAGLPAEPDPRDDTADSMLDCSVTPHGHDRLADLCKVLGNNVLAHKEKWVNLVTTFSVLGVAIKLAATTLPWNVRVPAAFFLSGWSSVQFLLYLFHLGELDGSSAGAVLKTIRLHRQLAKDPAIQRGMLCLVALVVAPPLIWLGYWAGFPSGGVPSTLLGPLDSTDRTGAYIYSHFLADLFWAMTCFVAAMLPICLAVGGFLFLFEILCGVFQVEYSSWGALLLGIPIVGTAIGSFVGGYELLVFLSHVEGVVRFFNGLIGAWVFLATSLMLILLVFGLCDCRLVQKEKAETSSQDDDDSALQVVLSTLICFYLFGGLVYTYDPTGTYKPAWLEYLG